MKVASHIYKAYDIRGIYGTELTEEVTYKTARAYAQLMKKENADTQLTIAVGADMRISTPVLQPEVLRGLTDEGINVVDVGLVSTPAFYYAVAKYEYDGGIMVTASHNPKEYNGLKFVRADVKPVSMDNGIAKIRDAVIADNLGDIIGGGTVEKKDGIVEEHAKYEVDWVGINNIKPLRIIADAANSMGATYVRAMFSHLPCELIEMNFELDGNMPSHEADQFKEENNAALMQQVVERKADLGIATDGDGDRIFFIDSEGNMIEPAIIRGLIAQLVLEREPGSTICYDIRPGRITRDMIIEAGGKPSVTKVGHSFIKAQAIEEGAAFAGESSGHFFMRTELGVFETPVIVAMMLLQYFSRSNESIADQVRPFRKYSHSGEINSEVEEKETMVQKLKDTYGKDAKNVSELDGITIEYEDYWFNVRPSNTESVLRLNLEAISEEVQKQKTKEILSIIRG